MRYSEIIKQTYKDNAPILLRYWWVFLGLSLLYHLYQYLIFKFIKASPEQLSNIIFLYYVLTYPVIVLVIMYLVDCYNKNHLPKDFGKLIADTKRCYLRIVFIYLVAELLERNLGFGAKLIVFAVMYIKLPFLEQEIFFKNSSLWKAIKNTNALTNEEDIMKIITILVIIFALVFYGIKNTNRIVMDLDVMYKQSIVFMISVIKLSFFFFCKAVLTKVYSNLK